jgi:hypothetical protein
VMLQFTGRLARPAPDAPGEVDHQGQLFHFMHL